MFIVGHFLDAVAMLLDVVLNLLLVVILVNALLSWVRPDPHHPLVQLLERISDFVCDPIRRLFPTTVGGIDFAPFIAMLLIVFLQRFAIASLRDVALRMG